MRGGEYPTQKPNSVYSGTYPAQKGDLTPGRKPGTTCLRPHTAVGFSRTQAETGAHAERVASVLSLSKQSTTETGIPSRTGLPPSALRTCEQTLRAFSIPHLEVICGADAEGCEQQRHAARRNRKTGGSAGRSESYIFIYRAKIGPADRINPWTITVSKSRGLLRTA